MLERYSFQNLVPRSDLAIGVVIAEGIKGNSPQPILDQKLQELLLYRKEKGLSESEEKFRQEARNILRNGNYRPTGRSKPASEYLLRESLSNQFPRIHSAVDINNYLSLKYMVPISLWDIDLAKTNKYVFRLGKKEESYIFNQAGQELKLEDLICGVALLQNNIEKAIITPVKDSLATKIKEQSQNLGLVIYYPLSCGSKEHLIKIMEEAVELFQELKPDFEPIRKILLAANSDASSRTSSDT